MFFKALAKINLFKPNVISLVALVFAGFILLVLLILYFYSQQHSILESVINQGEIQSRKMRINSELMELARSRVHLLSQLTDLDDPFEQDEKNVLLENAAGRYASLRNQLLEFYISAEERVIIDKQSEIIPLILPAFGKVVELAMRGNPADGIRAKNLMYDVVLPRQGELIDLLGELITLEQKTIQQLSENSRLSVQAMQYRSIFFIGFALIFIAILSLIVIARIRKIQNELLYSHRNLEQQVEQRTFELHSAELMLRSVLNNIPNRVYWKNKEGRYLGSNTLFAEDAGLPAIDELVDKTDWDLPWFELADYYREEDSSVIQSGDSILNKIEFINDKQGELIWIEKNKVPLLDETHEVIGMLGTYQDVTDRILAEKNLKNAIIDAEAANRSKSEFLATMSHEIRTPMNAVLGMAQLMEDTPVNYEQKGYLNTIKQSGETLLSIINDILDYSKLDAGMLEIESIAFNLEKICLECLELTIGNSTASEVEFLFDYDPECPRYFTGDPSRIRQIVINLLSNAVKFTHDGYIRLGISAKKTNSNNTQLQLEVEDTGIGIKEGVIGNLFEEFTQADQSTTRKYGGTGLGLSISKKLVKLMGGEIQVESIYGTGTTFSILLNLPLSDDPQPVKINSLGGVRVLFVDHNEKNELIFGRMLKYMGADTTIVGDYSEVVKTIQNEDHQNPFKIVIIDQASVGDKSLELTARIKQKTQQDDLKVLIFSPMGKKVDPIKYSRAGVDAHMSKFCRYDMLQKMLTTLLDKKSAQPLITLHSIEAARQPPGPPAKAKINTSVLVVEDVLPNQIITRKFLNNLGVNVDVASNGQEAVELYESNSYDFIFMDCHMPVMDGYQATRIIRETEKENNIKSPVPVIALTANASVQDRVLCEDSGMNDVVTKPFKQVDLKVSLQKWLPSLEFK